MAQLEKALEAYRAAQAAVPVAQEEAKAHVRKARDLVDTRRAEVAAAMVAEALAGVPQKEIIHRTGYARETVRTILRAGGVEPD